MNKVFKKPQILSRKITAKTRIFCVEELALKFSNGAERTYERMVSGGSGAVMVVAISEDEELILIREYSAGTNDYQLAFPKGLRDEGETLEEAANRELMEEVGLGAGKITHLKNMTLAPGYFTHRMDLFLAESLYIRKLEGDEPEPLEVVRWPLENVDQLLENEHFTEARSIAALLLVVRLRQGVKGEQY
ncbi:ADP compounds hydrolase NudE [Aliikangiella sp. G2MR2-5]|uniref:ADP compounds hydrolase NudE n=1 Tax=Aliikangiella sp. G2MR2-5 TaxID=2788943 RepID=UPI0018AA9D00|nr:ADP compounds hydrolase NudE [Aliikangiella sp. G2MR2-5]